MATLDLSKSLNKFGEIIRKDTANGVKRGSQFGKPFKPNAESTIKQKKHSKPLIGKKGTWTKASNYEIDRATKQKQEVTITVPNADIALINQTSKKHARPFWGVSKKAVDSMNKSVDYDINKWIDKEIINMGCKKV